MVRKIAVCLLVSVLLLGAFCTGANAKSYTIYENGNINNTYLTYFRDILGGIGFNDNYCAFRSGEKSYTMVVGDLEFGNSSIFSNGSVTEYEFSVSGGAYNSQYYYYVNEIDSFELSIDNQILYSDVGNYPQLMERGAKYEIITAALLCIALVGVVVSRIFNPRKR